MASKSRNKQKSTQTAKPVSAKIAQTDQSDPIQETHILPPIEEPDEFDPFADQPHDVPQSEPTQAVTTEHPVTKPEPVAVGTPSQSLPHSISYSESVSAVATLLRKKVITRRKSDAIDLLESALGEPANKIIERHCGKKYDSSPVSSSQPIPDHVRKFHEPSVYMTLVVSEDGSAILFDEMNNKKIEIPCLLHLAEWLSSCNKIAKAIFDKEEASRSSA